MKIPKFLIFNFFTRQYLSGFDPMRILGRRLNAMSMDFSLMIAIIFPIPALFFIPYFIIIESLDKVNELFPIWIGIIPFSIFSFFTINKDYYKAKSIAKRHFGYQVYDLKSNEPATELQCVIRNSTIIIWPLEVLVSMFNSHSRLGDLLAGTKLIDADKEDPELIMNEIAEKGAIKDGTKLIWVSVLISLLLSTLSVLPELLTLIEMAVGAK
jgi:uncharacterized RDD family membrane protein YckC